ncbi:LemA family protein [Microbacterium indicum]|uniref:LemA family protein n=1 Tax=Microbacterium indicum TaxID=358100 RepID=UPI0004001256|nr:LemA family protein [Microbacterium indicum]
MEWLVPVLIVAAILVIAGIYLWATYKSLVSLGARVDEAWSAIDEQVRSRADLVPGLIDTVSGYAAHEKAVFENVTRARTDVLSAEGPAAAGVAESRMQKALSSVFALAEGYPALQANQTYLQLQTALVDAEDGIQTSRRFYNGGVRELNVKVKQFPSNLFAGRRGLSGREYFESEDAAAISAPPRVQF